ncbi:MAG TPA: archaemetzincin family Zn-dependent metalloprotease [Terriglobales bacterium]|nr:archaemetzincin family Zn-dependent metalloprotease [Terriglobales bacterium]
MKLLHLLPIGNCDGRLLQELGAAMAGVFRVPFLVLPRALDPEFAFHPERQQYHSSEILAAMQPRLRGDCWRVLGVAAVDLYIPILTFVFGEAQIGGGCAVISSYRLRQEFYGLAANAELLRERLLKEAIHEIGHTLELTHCQDYRCAMAASHAVEWIDIKEAWLCSQCQSQALTGGPGKSFAVSR